MYHPQSRFQIYFFFHVQHHARQTVTKSERGNSLQRVASSTVNITDVTKFIHHILSSASLTPILSEDVHFIGNIT